MPVQKTNRKWVSPSLILQVRENQRDHCRFGLTVTKKISKSAVVRNRIRRRLRAAACDVLPGSAASGYDFVLIGRKETETLEYAKLTGDLRWCVKRLGCLKDAP